VDSELSGNMIDICPVGALTSKPFRYSARTWELSRRKSVSPHDSTGANLIVQVKNNKVMRVVPLENEDVNECWIADRDRFSYEALNGEDRLTQPMLKQGGQWKDGGLADRAGIRGQRPAPDQGRPWRAKHRHAGQPAQHRGRAVPGRRTGARPGQREHRLPPAQRRIRPLRRQGPLAGHLHRVAVHLQRVLVVGSNLRKDHPLFAQRIRQAIAKVARSAPCTRCRRLGHAAGAQRRGAAASWAQALADVAAAIASRQGCEAPAAGNATDAAKAIAQSLLGGERKAVLLGNAAHHHAGASSLLALANWIGQQTGATVGYLTEAANTVGAQLAGAQPGNGGLNAGQMLANADGALKAVLLLNTEPRFDSAAGAQGAAALGKAQMVVTLSPFKANMDISDVLLPIAPFTETSGTFVNAEGRVQGFHAVVKPLGETRPAWKVLRVLANLMGVPGFDFESSQDVLVQARGAQDAGQTHVAAGKLDNTTTAPINLAAAGAAPVSASIYQLDGIVRRAASLQLTADAGGPAWPGPSSGT
jgi:NADH-quinone oxidoreductase subunit G